MMFARNAWFLIRFAAQDLFERSCRTTTYVNTATVLFLFSVAWMTIALTWGLEAVEMDVRSRNPLNRCLFVGNGIARDVVTPESTARLEAGLRAALARPTALLGCCPFRDVSYVFSEANVDYGPTLVGRTVGPTDPILESVLADAHGKRLGPADRGFFVSPRLLATLGLPSNPPPPKLTIGGARGRLSVPVLGLTKRDLPLGHDFLLSEGYYVELLHADPNRTLRNIETGPIPPAWAEASRDDKLPARVLALLEKWRLRPRPAVRPHGDARHWALVSTALGKAVSESEWKIRLESLHDEMTAHGFPAAPGFANVASTETAPPPAAVPLEYQRVGVYVERLEDVPPAADVLDATFPNNFNRDVVDQIEQIGREMRSRLWVAGALLALTLVVMTWNMTVIEVLRADRKVKSVGMLKAIGMSKRRLEAISLIEATMIWLLGAAGGLLVGYVAGKQLAYRLHAEEPLSAHLGFASNWALLAGIAAATWGVSVLAGLLAGMSSRGAPPCESLRAD